MSRKTRKLMWPLPGMATFAIVAALAILVALPVGFALAQAAVETAGAAPANFTVADATGDDGAPGLMLTWEPPNPVLMYDPNPDNAPTIDDDIERQIQAYRIDVSKDGGGTWAWHSHVSGTESSETIGTGLMAGTTYNYRIYAVYLPETISQSSGAEDVEALISPPARASGTTDADTAAGAPDAPSGFGATVVTANDDANLGAGQVNLAWTLDAGFSYRIEYSLNNVDWMELASGIDGDTTANATKVPYGHVTVGEGMGNHNGLSEKTTYYYRIFAVNSDDVSSLPANHAVQTRAAIKPAKADLLVAHGGPGKITLYWNTPDDPAGAPVTGYRIMSDTAYDDTTGSTNDFTELVGMTPDSNTMYVHQPLNAGDKMYYQIYAINAAGEGPKSNVAVGTATAGAGTARIAAPDNFKAGLTMDDDELTVDVPPDDRPGKLRLEWDTVEGADHYMIQWSPDGEDGNWRPLVDDSSAVAHTAMDASPFMSLGPTMGMHVGLTAETTYYYQVFAVDDEGGKSPPSETDTGTTEKAEVPAAPTDLDAMAVGTQINLTWKAPAKDPAGAPVTGFRIDQMKKSGNWVTIANVGDVTSYSDQNLEAETEYTYRVYAKNRGKQSSGMITTASTHPGRSIASTTATATTGVAGATPVGIKAPTNVVVTVSGNSITVTWTDGTGPAGLKHDVGLFTSDLSEFVDFSINDTDNTHTFTGVDAGEYAVFVAAYTTTTDGVSAEDVDATVN